MPVVGLCVAVIGRGNLFNPKDCADFNKAGLPGYKFARRRDTGRYEAQYEKKMDNCKSVLSAHKAVYRIQEKR